jgi:hypothetical protein
MHQARVSSFEEQNPGPDGTGLTCTAHSFDHNQILVKHPLFGAIAWEYRRNTTAEGGHPTGFLENRSVAANFELAGYFAQAGRLVPTVHPTNHGRIHTSRLLWSF